MSYKEKVGIMERRKALETARNILYSKVGKVVLDENKFPDRTLELQHRRIDGESKKNQCLIENDKKRFKKNRLIYNLEPTILMERPASPVLMKQVTAGAPHIPHYMTAIHKPKTPVEIDMPTTIDAFTMIKRKNKNIWETKLTDKDLDRKFRSIIMNSPPLNDLEEVELDKGFLLHRPASKNEQDAQKRIAEKRQERIDLIREDQHTPEPDPIMTFITQLERDAESRSSKRTASNTSKGIYELEFNERHLEKFEKIRAKQKQEFFNKIKL